MNSRTRSVILIAALLCVVAISFVAINRSMVTGSLDKRGTELTPELKAVLGYYLESHQPKYGGCDILENYRGLR